MEPHFWLERWESGQTGWDQDEPHPTLVSRWSELGLAPGSAVFVPLCGASVDMTWLADRGHRVIGAELSELGVRRFFDRVGETPTIRTSGASTVFTAGPYELWCGDIFELDPDELSGVAAVYDRASLIALPPDVRRRYGSHVATLVPDDAVVFLLTLLYDPSEMTGPPFAVPADEVDTLFGDHFDVEFVGESDMLGHNPDLAGRGLTWMREHLHLLRRR